MKLLITLASVLALSSCFLSEDKVTEQQLMSTQKQYIDTIKVKDVVSDTTYQVITKHLSDSTTVYDTVRIVRTAMVIDTIKHVIDSTIYLKDTIRTVKFDTLTKNTVVKMDTLKQVTVRYDTVKVVTTKLDTVKQVLVKYDTTKVTVTRLDTLKQVTVVLDTIHFVSSDTIHVVVRDTVAASLPMFGVLSYGGQSIPWYRKGALKYMLVSGTLLHSSNKDVYVTITQGLYGLNQSVGSSALGDVTCNSSIVTPGTSLCHEAISDINYKDSLSKDTVGTITLRYPRQSIIGKDTAAKKVLSRLCPTGYRLLTTKDASYISAYMASSRDTSGITMAYNSGTRSLSYSLDTISLRSTGAGKSYAIGRYQDGTGNSSMSANVWGASSLLSNYASPSEPQSDRECVSGTVPTN